MPQSLRLVRGLLLVSLSAAGSTVAALGLGLLAYLLLSRTLTPAQHLHSRTLHLDYSQTDLIAQTAFLPAEEYGDGALPPNLPANTRCARSEGGRASVQRAVHVLCSPLQEACMLRALS